MHTPLVSTTILALSLASSALPARANDGDLDRAFGRHGKVMTDFGHSTDLANAVAIQPDGKLVVVGTSYTGDFSGEDFAVVRYDSEGHLDRSFGKHGKVTTDFPGLAAVAATVVLQPDGKILVAGTAFPEFVFAGTIEVARYDADGTLDPSFGSGGIVTTHCPNQGCSAAAMALQADGKIVVAGTDYVDFSNQESSNTDFAIMRYGADGKPDAGFGNHGLVMADFDGFNDGAQSVLVQPDGRIVAFGSATSQITGTDFAAVRYLANGTLDASFGTGGKARADFGTSGMDQALSAVLQPDGRIVAGGFAQAANGFQQDFALARFNADGSLDPTFNGSGTRRIDFGGCCQGVTKVLLQPDGKIVAAGFPNTESSDADFVLVRLTAQGEMDRSFGHAGKVRTSFGDLNGAANGAALQADGKIVAVGFQATAGVKSAQFAVARYLGTSSDR
jgi:uncharacterized delta-60 repeat protein